MKPHLKVLIKISLVSLRFSKLLFCVFQDSHLSVSHSGSQEGLGNDTKSDNWGDLNGNVNINGNGLSGNSEFSPAVSSPKRIKNKSCKTKDFVLIELSSKLEATNLLHTHWFCFSPHLCVWVSR